MSLLKCYVIVFYVDSLLTADTFFTHGYAWLRLVTLSHELLYFLGLDLYTVSVTLIDGT